MPNIEKSAASPPPRETKERACPICKKPAVPIYRPFCSRRCADVDLGRWLGGAYVVEGHEQDAEDSGEPPVR